MSLPSRRYDSASGSRTYTDDLTRPVIGLGDIPLEPEPAEPNRDLPVEIMRQLCAHLDQLTSPAMRTAVELAIDTGRRPEEICDLDFDCLARDQDGLPVLVYDNHKANRPRRRLPISERTAALITAQQHRVRVRYPDTPVGELKLLPTDRRNPGGRRAITGFSLAFAHRAWVDRLPVLRTDDGIEYDKTKIVLYAYRHSYAQRHADAGVPVEVLRELMSHRKLETKGGYYRVGQTGAVRPSTGLRRRSSTGTVTACLAASPGAAGPRAHSPRGRRSRRPVRGLRRTVQRHRRRRRLPVPVPLRRLRPLPHRRLLPARPAGLPR